jgi:heat shock protein HslJ
MTALCATQWVNGLAGAKRSSTQNSLANTQWRLSSFGSSGSLTSVLRGTSISLNFGPDGRVSGNAGCNSYAGDYRVREESISFSRLVSTKRACIDDAANRQESRYLSALESANRFQLRDDRLTIHYGDGGNTLNFVNDSAVPDGGRGEESPLRVIDAFYDAVNSRDYERAFRLWETPPQKFDDFVRGYSDTVKVQVLTDPNPSIEGAAGSLYADIPTILLVRRRNGAERMFAGCYVARKSNVEQSGWRIYRAKLSPVSSATRISELLNPSCRS